MERNNVTQYQLLQSGIDNHTLDSLKKNRNITMITLEKLCRIIGCTPDDVVFMIQNFSFGVVVIRRYSSVSLGIVLTNGTSAPPIRKRP